MMLWFLFAVLTAAVVAVVLRPLVTAEAAAPANPVDADIAVYNDQLAEIAADTTRGILQPAEADLARREVARRLLARADAGAGVAPSPLAVRPLILGLAGLIPVAALASYVGLGSPNLPAQPFAARPVAPLVAAPVAELVTKVEARLAQNPADGQGWDVIAPVYFRLERFADAAQAFERAGLLLGETPQRLAGFAEATVLASNGIVTEAARAAYEKLARIQPERIEPKFWLALAKEQDGRLAEAAADYRGLLATAPAEAPWRPMLVERLAAVTPIGAAKPPAPTASVPQVGGPSPAGPAQRGPSPADVKLAESLSDGDRAQMIRGMVDGLAKRLESNPADVQGWVRLVQSYVVLGERDKAVASLTDARRKLAGNPAALDELSALARTLGLDS
jgi:cytochrome c-type biogenesis protein CcmH